jgi:proline racemase
VTAPLRVSEAAHLVGVSPSTLRAWEALGLIHPSRQGRFRWFSPADVKELQKIASLRARGYNTTAIRTMLRRDDGAAPSAPPAAGPSGNVPGRPLGRNLRAMRRRRGLSLREAAEQAEISVSHLSAIERGTRNISLAGLQRLAVALGIQVSDLFGGRQRQAGRVVRAGERPVLETGDPRVRVESLSVGAKLLEPHMYVAEPGGGSDGSYHHEGEEIVYILEGTVEFWLNEVERHVAHAGDCLTFPSTLRHRWLNAGPGRLVMLWVNTPITF